MDAFFHGDAGEIAVLAIGRGNRQAVRLDLEIALALDGAGGHGIGGRQSGKARCLDEKLLHDQSPLGFI